MSPRADPVHLLDANLLIALVVADHEHHARADRWVARDRRIALCPITEGSLVRYLVRVGEPAAVATAALQRLHADPRCSFWPDDASYADVDLRGVYGHRQVTDTYLVALLGKHGKARLATLDRALVGRFPDHCTLID